MAVNISGATTGTGAEVETNTRALRVTQRPQDVGSLGAYSLGIDNGGTVMTAGLAADSEIYQFRWTDATRLAIVRGVYLSAGSVTAFAAGRCKFDLFFATSWTVAGTLGGTATITGRNGKKRTSFGTTLLGEIRVANTVALGTGTKTLDGSPLATLAQGVATAVGPIVPAMTPLWKRDTGDEYPVVLAQNEGLVIRAAVAGTGTWYFGVTVEWAELTAF
jgi:hypothetical protein